MYQNVLYGTKHVVTGRERDDEDDDEGDESHAVLSRSAQRSDLSRLQDGPLFCQQQQRQGHHY